jgi:hypothetical protein
MTPDHLIAYIREEMDKDLADLSAPAVLDDFRYVVQSTISPLSPHYRNFNDWCGLTGFESSSSL